MASCQVAEKEHTHTPDSADCQHVQYCADCGKPLAEQGPHTYSEQPQTQHEGYLYYVCSVCGKIKIVNEDGFPVVPVE